MEITIYKEYLYQRNLSENTIDSYIYDVESFRNYLREDYELELNETKKAHILTYLVTLQKNGKSSSTLSRTISALKNFFDFLAFLLLRIHPWKINHSGVFCCDRRTSNFHLCPQLLYN